MKTTAMIITDFCPGCMDPSKEEGHMHLIDMPISIRGKEYGKVCVPLCDTCSSAKEANRLRANLKYAVSEGYLF